MPPFFMAWQCEMTSKTISMLKSPYIWAIIEYGMFHALMSGGKMFIASPAGHKSPKYLAESICSQKVAWCIQRIDLDIFPSRRRTAGPSHMPRSS